MTHPDLMAPQENPETSLTILAVLGIPVRNLRWKKTAMIPVVQGNPEKKLR